MGNIVRFTGPHEYEGVSERARLTQRSVDLVLLDDRDVPVPHSFPRLGLEDEDDRDLPLHIAFSILAYISGVVLVIALSGKAW